MTTESVLTSTTSFFKKMFSDSSEVSSKRVVGFMSAFLLVIMTFWHLITKQAVQSDFIWGSISLSAACFGLNAYITGKAISTASDADDVKKPE